MPKKAKAGPAQAKYDVAAAVTPGSLVNIETHSDGLSATTRPISADDDAGRGARGPRHLPRARHKSCAHRHADHRHRGDAERERNRRQQEFQPRAHAVAGQRLGAEAGEDFGEDQDRQHGLQRRQAGHRADLEDVEEHGALKFEAPEIQRQPAAAADQIPGQEDGAERECGQLAGGDAAHAELGQAEQPEAQCAADRDLHQRGADQRHRRDAHVAGAAHHRGQRIHQPDRDRAGEQHLRILHRLFEHDAAPAEQRVERAAEGQHHHGEKQSRRRRRSSPHAAPALPHGRGRRRRSHG